MLGRLAKQAARCGALAALACAAPAPTPAPTTAAACREPPAQGPVVAAAPKPALAVSGSWSFRCCDGKATWTGLVVLTQEEQVVHGAWVTDGDSHGSYLSGSVQGQELLLVRRWLNGHTPHEQRYELKLDATGQKLSGTFNEPAFEPYATHSVELARGFHDSPAAPPVDPTPVGNTERSAPDPVAERLKYKGPCDCGLVCYCGGVPPGPEHYAESARCGGSCRCPACPPLP